MNQELTLELKALISLYSNSEVDLKIQEEFEKIDWELFIQLCKEHRIITNIYDKLKAARINIPKQFANTFTQEDRRIKTRMLYFTAEINSLTKLFQEKEIETIFLKGPVAAKQIYNEFTSKNSRDIDFLVREDSIEKCIDLLENNNYQITYPFENLTERQKKYFIKTNNQLAFYNTEKHIQVEMHWRLFANPFLLPYSFSELLYNGEDVAIGNTMVKALGKDHLLFYLCSHGAKHQWHLMYWLLEVKQLAQKENYDWKDILDKAIKIGADRSLIQAIVLIGRVFQETIPEEFKAQLKKDKTTIELINKAQKRILEGHDRLKDDLKSYGRSLSYKMKLRKGLKYKLAYLNLLSNNDFQVLKLPNAIFILYYPLRPFIWCWRFIIKTKN